MMMKHGISALTIFILVFPLAVFGEQTDTLKTKKIFLSASFSPDYCYRILAPDAAFQWIVDNREEKEIAKIGYTTGATLIWQFKNQLQLETGLLFANKGYKTKNLQPVWITPSGNSPSNDPAIPLKLMYRYRYFYIDIPLKANYYILTNKLKLFITGGLSPSLFLVQQTKSIYEFGGGRIDKNTYIEHIRFSRINVTAFAGFGFGYALNQKLSVQLQPICRTSITSIINSPIKQYLYSGGIDARVILKL